VVYHLTSRFAATVEGMLVARWTEAARDEGTCIHRYTHTEEADDWKIDAAPFRPATHESRFSTRSLIVSTAFNGDRAPRGMTAYSAGPRPRILH